MNRHADLVLISYLFKICSILVVFISALSTASTGEISYLFVGCIVAVQVYIIGAVGLLLVGVSNDVHISAELSLRQYQEKRPKEEPKRIKRIKDAS